MFVTDFQFEYMMDSLFIGISGGFFYLVIRFFKSLFPAKAFCFFADMSSFALLFFYAFRFSRVLGLPDLRLYILAGILSGFAIPSLIFGKTVANFGVLVYNKGRKLRRKRYDRTG